jgi:hypothetical protein
MTNHFYLGGINTKTNKMELSNIALKTNNYKCPECDNDIILKKGKIKKAHFSHKANSNCRFYDRQGETATHWNAKYMMKNKLEHRHPLIFYCKCNCCRNKRTTVIEYNNLSIPIVEHRYSQQHSTNYWFADVALLTGNHIDNIIEIIHTSKTDEWKRDGYKWVEVKAEDVNMETNEYVCQREYTCDDCIELNNQRLLKQKQRELEEELAIKTRLELKRFYDIEQAAKKQAELIARQKKDIEQAAKKQAEIIERHYLDIERRNRENEELLKKQLIYKQEQEERLQLKQEERLQLKHEEPTEKKHLKPCILHSITQPFNRKWYLHDYMGNKIMAYTLYDCTC